MRQIRSSQSLTPHHHASEHSNIFTIIGSQLAPLPRSDNPMQRSGPNFMNAQRIHKIQYAYPDAPKPIHPDKEQIRSQTIQLGNKHPNPNRADLSRNGVADIRNSVFPVNMRPSKPPKFLVEMDGIEPTTPCLQSRCSTN